MGRRFVVIALLAAAMLLLSAAGAPHTTRIARAALTWEVETQGPVDEGQFVLSSFFPNPLTIRAGDSVRWTVAGGHTVTFLGERREQPVPPQFVPGGPFPGGRVAGAGFSPIGPEGGYDGVELRSSGRLVAREDETYTFTFTRVGVYPYLCLTHPGMNGAITVLPQDADLAETPAQAQARGQAEGETVLANTRAGVRAVRTASAQSPNGTQAHAVAAGVTNGSGGSALQFLPAELTLRRGDLVTWLVADPPEPHTVTFTSGAPAPEFVEAMQQADGIVRFGQRAEAFAPMGGTRDTGQGYLNSGQMLGGARGLIAFAIAVDAPPGRYEYLCLIHREMKGTIVVTE